MTDMLERCMDRQNKVLKDRYYSQKRSMLVDYEMVNLEYQQDYTGNDPGLKLENKILEK